MIQNNLSNSFCTLFAGQNATTEAAKVLANALFSSTPQQIDFTHNKRRLIKACLKVPLPKYNETLFTKFVLSWLIQDSPILEDSIFTEIDQSNLKTALILAVYAYRLSNLSSKKVTASHVQKYLPLKSKNSSSVSPSDVSSSLCALEKVVNGELKQISESLKLRSVRPAREILQYADRDALNVVSNEIIKNPNNIKNIIHASNDLISRLEKLLSMHKASMAAKVTADSFIEEIINAIKIGKQFIKRASHADSDAEIEGVLDSMIERITDDITFPEALILSEIAASTLNKMKERRAGNRVLASLNKALTSFTSEIKRGTPYKICAVFPGQREEFLHDKTTETYKCLTKFGESLRYSRYISSAKAFESITRLERVTSAFEMMMQLTFSDKMDDASKNTLDNHVGDAMKAFETHMEIDCEIRKLLRNFRGSPISPNGVEIFDVELGNEFSFYNFDKALRIPESLTSQEIDQLLGGVIERKRPLFEAKLALNFMQKRKCVICGEYADVIGEESCIFDHCRKCVQH